MISVDASSAALALTNGEGSPPTPASTGPSKMPFRVGDKLVGQYTCSQGRTELTLTIDEVGRGEDEIEVEATFEFHVNNSRASASGSFRTVGTYDARTRRMRLRGEEWLDQPPGYGFVGLNGVVNKTSTTYGGSVDGTGCTSFSTTLERGAKD